MFLSCFFLLKRGFKFGNCSVSEAKSFSQNFYIKIIDMMRQFSFIYLIKLIQLGGIDLFLYNDSFIIAYHISLVKVLTNYFHNNLLILDVKRLNKIIKLYYFHTLKALWDGQGKIKFYYGISRVKNQLSGKSSILHSHYHKI